MERKNWLLLSFFVFFLIFFAVFAARMSFHDSHEYITNAKTLAGFQNVNIFIGHSLLYPGVIAFFLKIWPSLMMIRLVNTFWFFLIGLVLLLWLKNEKAFILFAFSPLVWYCSIQTSPIFPAAFFFLLAFLFFQKTEMKYSFLYSGLCMGLSIAFYDPMILFAGIFILVYFWKESFLDLFKYSIFICMGFLPRMIQDYYLFKMPFYTLIRYVGCNFIVALGLNPNIRTLQILEAPEVLLIFVAISPFLFRLHRMNFSRNKQLIIFLTLSFLVCLIKAAMIKYFLIISPIIIILLSKNLTDKEIKWHCILSIPLVVFLTWNFFIVSQDNQDSIIKQDVQNIMKDYDNKYILATTEEILSFSVFSWEDKPYFVWWQDFEAGEKNQTRMRGYDFGFGSKIPLKEDLVFSASFNRFEKKTYDDYILVTQKTKDKFPEISNFKWSKCYQKLCVYEK